MTEQERTNQIETVRSEFKSLLNIKSNLSKIRNPDKQITKAIVKLSGAIDDLNLFINLPPENIHTFSTEPKKR